MEFSTLALDSELKRGLAEADFISAMPVQAQVIANAFSGRDLYVQSQTGTGKTLAYLIVIMQRLISEPALVGRKALIMVPTRELAVQVEDEAKLLGKYLPFKTGAFYGGVGYGAQQKILRDDAQILIGTPGRVLDLNASGQMNLMNIAFLVLDEADRMFDMGFYPDLRKLVKVVPPADRRQTMLFSATLNTYVKNLAYEYTKEPLEIEIEPEHITVNEICQLLYHVPATNKMKLLLGILRREDPESAIIFCNTKRYTEIVAKRLQENGIPCEFISGDLPQQKRLAIIESLKAGKTRFLVATDVAARGLDVEGLALVINYDLPSEAENYVHRIGRTARAGKTGRAISFASEQDVYELADIEKYIENKIPAQVASDNLYGEEIRERRPPRQREDARREQPGHAVPPRQREQRRPKTVRHGRSQNPTIQDERTADPSVLGLPLEERMAYYKNKYSGKKPAESGVSRSNNESGGGKNAQSRRRRKPEKSRAAGETASAPSANTATGSHNNKTAEQQAGQRKGRSRRGRQERGADSRNAAQTVETGRSSETSSTKRQDAAAPQKGILSRLLNIFTKNK
ncbi:MAG: DEAD/DEAH box helicase [Spirochaetaceae bacterium]|jgi:ATP-dependent RNA helicase RhlB|nr:DEAD/DEAH box helicase [Spirochaetaceae bacterium]